jgi:flavin-dependent dehydrogenase
VTDVDVVVVGGGPVGLAAAVAARERGLEVLVLEPRPGPVDKACGEGLMPGTLAALQRLGVDPPGHLLSGITYLDGRHRADHAFRRPGRGVRRTVLHEALAARAADAQVTVVPRRVGELRWTSTGVLVEGVSARWLLGCDGLHSTVRRLAGLEGPPARVRRYGLRRHHVVAPWTDRVEVHWAGDVEAYVTPVGPELVGVAVLGPAGRRPDDALAELPALREHLRGTRAGEVRGAGPLFQRSLRRTAGPVRLVGDAAGYVDALTGEGLRVGLAQAAAAVTTLEDPAAYERAWRAVTRDYRLLTRGLLAWAGSPARGALVPAAARVPWLFDGAVELLAR